MASSGTSGCLMQVKVKHSALMNDVFLY